MLENGCQERYVRSQITPNVEEMGSTDGVEGDIVESQNIWGMLSRKSVLEMNGRCAVRVETANDSNSCNGLNELLA